MIWYWKKEIVPKRHLGTVDGFWAGDVDWLRIDGSFAHGDVYGVLLKSALAMVMDMNRLFIYDERSVGGTTVFLRIIQSWSDSILLSILNDFKLEDTFENQLISQRQLYFFWKLRVFQKSLDFIYAGGWRTSTSTSTKSSTLFRRCAEMMEYRSLLANTTSSTPLTLKVCRSSCWMWILVCM